MNRQTLPPAANAKKNKQAKQRRTSSQTAGQTTAGLSPAECSGLVALFNAGRHAEMEQQARLLLRRSPESVYACKALGAALQAQGKEALSVLQQTVELMPDDAEAHFNLAGALKQPDRLNQAVQHYCRALEINPEFGAAYSGLGAVLKELGQLDEAIACYRHAARVNSGFASAHCDLGIVLAGQGQFDAAVLSYRRALEIEPDFAEVHCNLGNVFRMLGQLEEAVASCRRALQLKPDFADAHNNLAMALRSLGRFGEAVACYQRALQIRPEFVEAHSNLANALKDLGRLEEAEAGYCRALAIQPDFPCALNNLAVLLNARNEPFKALRFMVQSLRIERTAEARNIFVDCIRRLRFVRDDSEIRALMVPALTEPWGRPNEMAPVCIDFVKLNPAHAECIEKAQRAWPAHLAAADLFGAADPARFDSDTLFCVLLESTPVCDIALERFLTMARRSLLDSASQTAATGDSGGAAQQGQRFFCSLARQCFINEYVFCHADDEIQSAGRLRDRLAAALQAGSRVPPLWLIAVAAYFPLHCLAQSGRLLEQTWDADLAALLRQQIGEPDQELQLCMAIPRLTGIDDPISLQVQNQYEENPYPRWVRTGPAGQAKNINAHLSLIFPLAGFRHAALNDCLDVLIAGCGTGQHPIETAQQLLGARILAIDLSLSSLGYAKRKTLELGLTSIEYAQADLLQLAAPGRSFDVIESAGVLHHLADPWEGWRVLLSLLRPGGFMRLGFYSEIARRNLVKVRQFIAGQGLGPSAGEIRRCRQELIDPGHGTDFASIPGMSDFFSISACRDLLFHVQEHRMTLSSIERFLDDQQLTLLGLETSPEVLQAYKRRFPDDPAATCLSQWQIFENEHPDTFLGMYQFWVQKAT